MQEISIMEIGNFKVGHATDNIGMTGCTVILPDNPSPCGVDIRGGGPASRETPLLLPVSDASEINGIVLSGGSAFGLNAAGGVMKYLEDRGIGFDVGVTKVPLIVQSCLFDLAIGDMKARPDEAMGYKACENASYEMFEEGNVGAGTGCTVGKLLGADYCMKSGIGSYAVQVGELKVGAIVAVNALGDIYDINTGKEVAGILKDNKLVSSEETLYNLIEKPTNLFKTNTTLGVILTNARYNKTELTKISQMAHNGYARAIRPVHTMADGDSIYSMSLGNVESDINVVGTLASTVMANAILKAAKSSKSYNNIKAACDL